MQSVRAKANEIMQEYGVDVRTLSADLSDRSGIDAVKEQLLSQAEPISILLTMRDQECIPRWQPTTLASYEPEPN